MEQIRFIQTGLRSINKEERTAEFIISDGSIDRHGTVLDERWSLDNYNANGIVGYQHDVYGVGFLTGANPDNVIGKGTARIETKYKKPHLIGSVEFEPKEINELAEKIFQKLLFGSLKATSVGFIPLEPGEMRKIKEGKTEREVFYFGNRDLLEWSIVNIPSNPNALGRAFGEDINGLYQFAEKEEKLFENEHTAHIREPNLFNPDTFKRTKGGRAATSRGVLNIPETVSASWAKLKDTNERGDTPVLQSLRFVKEDWTEAEVKKYLEDNKIKFISFEPANKIYTFANKLKRLQLMESI